MARGTLTVLDAPSNLGLSPPDSGCAPGCYKLPWALRDRGLLGLLNADDAGCVVPPRYNAQWTAGEGDRNALAMAGYSVRLADRLQPLIEQGRRVLVLGGDCSILLGNLLALKRRGRYGLVFLDAHSDFRHPGNADDIRAAAGEDLAIVTGRGDARLVNLEGCGPYVQEEDVHVVGVRENDEYLADLTTTAITLTTSQTMAARGIGSLIDQVLTTVTRHTEGFWIHLDLDVVDGVEMFAADCPEPDGPSFARLAALLKGLFRSPQCVGIDVTIYDPDLDPSGVCAERIVQCLRQALSSD